MARFPAHVPLYEVIQKFLQRCLLSDQSLLWPERAVWTIDHLELFRRRFVEGFIQGRMTFREKLEAQLSGAPPEVWALAADCFTVYGLPSRTIRFRTKLSYVDWAARRAGFPLPAEDDPIWAALRHGFAPTGQKYNLKHAQIRLLILMALEVKAAADPAGLLASPEAFQRLLDTILEEIPLRIDRAYDMRNAILYLTFPDFYEPMLANRDKDAVLRHYGAGTGLNLPGDRDAALRQVRKALEMRMTAFEQEFHRPFDFYDDLREEWRPVSSGLEKAIAAQVRELRAGYHAGEAPALAAFAADVQKAAEDRWTPERAEGWPPGPEVGGREDDPDARRVLAALRMTRNVILSGPPGTGKTYLAARVARRIVDTPSPRDASEKNGPGYLWWVTLHPSYSYEDFVEGLRPVLVSGTVEHGEIETKRENGLPAATQNGEEPESGGVAYQVRPGVFRQVCERAAADPSHPYVLVLDEINRGPLAKILGELITLIDDDKRGLLHVRLPYSGKSFTVPPNLILLGTMNTTDRSVALLDAALRRRFAFVEIAPRPELLAGTPVETEEAVLHLDELLRCLNAAITQHLGRDHQIGHSYFLRVVQAAPEERLSALELVWNNQVLPLLGEYFYTRRERLADLLGPLLEETASLDPYGVSDPLEAARLTGEDLVVGLSRMCQG